MHSSQGRSRRKRGGDDEAPLLVSRADDARSDAYTRSSQYSHHPDTYRPTASSRGAYDMGREASSSRSHHETDDWRHREPSRSSHDRYSYSSSKDPYRRSGRDDYDIADTRDANWGSRATENHYPSTRDWGHGYDPDYPSSSYQESPSWGTYESRGTGYDWPEDTRRPIEDRSHSRPTLEERDSAWRRDMQRKGSERPWGDSGWDTRHDAKKVWEKPSGWSSNQSESSHRPTAERSWEPSHSWKPASAGDTQPQGRPPQNERNQHRPRNNHKSKGKKNGRDQKQQKRDWRTDESGPNNWQKRDTQNYSGKPSRPPKKRKPRRSVSPSRSRSPVESQRSHRSSRGRSRSRSASPKRRRQEASPLVSPSDRGRPSKPRHDRKYSESPPSSPHSRDQRPSRRRSPSTSSSSRSRSSSRSAADHPRPVHRLPTATPIKDISIQNPVSKSRGSTVPNRRDPEVHRNGKTNGKRRAEDVTHSSAAAGSMGPPKTPAAGHKSQHLSPGAPSPHALSDSPNYKGSRAASGGAGFKPIGQSTSSLKRFFPGDDEEDDAESVESRPADDTKPRSPLRSSGSGSYNKSMPPNSEPRLRRETYPPPSDNSPAWSSGHPSKLDPRKSKTPSPNEASQVSSAQKMGASPRLDTKITREIAEDGGAGAQTPSVTSRNELYQILNQVGEGTFGKVYKAQNTLTGVHVALKRIRMESERDGFPVTAMREIKLLQSLRHENVVRLYEMMVSNVNVYMVFEYMDHDLTGVLSQSQFSFTDANLKSLCLQMLKGLAYLHHKGVIHRDIKGSNILINNRGELKLADFGLARFYQKRRRSDYTNRVITLWYRPPELLLGATVYGPEVDMWSAGCIMLELFTKKPIFQGNDEIHQLEVIYKIFGTPTIERWPGVQALPWYELVKPKESIPNRFRDLFQRWLTPAGLDLAELLLSYDPNQRITAVQAMEAPYFREEDPPPSLPTGLSTLEGEWHELETKRERAKKRRRTEVVPQ